MRPRSSTLYLHERFEHALEHLGRDAGAVVFDAHHDIVTFRSCTHGDLAVWRRVTRGVVEQIGEDLREAHEVALDHERRVREIDQQLVRARGEQWAARLQRRTHRFDYVERLLLELYKPSTSKRLR